MFTSHRLVRGLLVTGLVSLAALLAPACVDDKGDLPKGVVDESSPPGVPAPLAAGKADGARVFDVALESVHPYPNHYARNHVLVLDDVVPKCATRVRLHFAALRTERDYDFVRVATGAGQVVQTLHGHHDGTWSAWVPVPAQDKRVIVRLDSDYSITDYGFRVDAVEAETSVSCPAVAACGAGQLDATPSPGVCGCVTARVCVPDGDVVIEHTVGGGFLGEVRGRKLVGTDARTVTYRPGFDPVEGSIGAIQRGAVAELVRAIVDGGLFDQPDVSEWSNWNETFSVRIGAQRWSGVRLAGTFPADEAALIARFEELFTCGGTAPLACADDHVCRESACVEDEGCFCPAVYQPVCGADGRTYSNACAAGCAGVAWNHEGECGIAGDPCGGIAALGCQDGHKCRYGTSRFEAPFPDAAGSCVAETYCDAPADCAGLPHIAVPGTWACEDNACAWRAGTAWRPVADWAYVTYHPYQNNLNEWKELFLPAGATRLRLLAHGPFELEHGYDKLEVWAWRNGGWLKVRTYTGDVGPAPGDELAGRYFYLHLVTDSSVTRYGFDLTAEYVIE